MGWWFTVSYRHHRGDLVLMKRLLLALLLFSGAAHAQGVGGAVASDPDPFVLNEAGFKFVNIPLHSTFGRSPLAVQKVDSSKKNLGIIEWGQSNDGNTAPSAYTPANPTKIINVNLYDGGFYTGGSDTLIGGVSNQTVGCSGNPNGYCLGNYAVRLADQLITDTTFDFVYIVSESLGSTPISTWDTGSAGKPSRIAAGLARLAAKGLTVATPNATIVILGGIGETDCGLGTSQAAWVAAFNNVIAAAGPYATGVRWLVAKQSWNGTMTCAAIQSAQTAASPSGVINNAAGIYLGAVADSLVTNVCVGATLCRQADNLHFTDTGNQSYALDATNGWKAALHATGAPF
jgi:hypothetical protein